MSTGRFALQLSAGGAAAGLAAGAAAGALAGAAYGALAGDVSYGLDGAVLGGAVLAAAGAAYGAWLGWRTRGDWEADAGDSQAIVKVVAARHDPSGEGRSSATTVSSVSPSSRNL
jgi:hypothetical protein